MPFVATWMDLEIIILSDCKEIQPVHPKRDQSWVFIGRTNAEGETPILWLPVAKSWIIWKDPDSGKDWGQEEKRTTEDEMVGWHHWLNGQEFEQALGDSEGQGSLACCSPLGSQRVRFTEQLNNKFIRPRRQEAFIGLRCLNSLKEISLIQR